jgi:hypothetical protein
MQALCAHAPELRPVFIESKANLRLIPYFAGKLMDNVELQLSTHMLTCTLAYDDALTKHREAMIKAGFVKCLAKGWRIAVEFPCYKQAFGLALTSFLSPELPPKLRKRFIQEGGAQTIMQVMNMCGCSHQIDQLIHFKSCVALCHLMHGSIYISSEIGEYVVPVVTNSLLMHKNEFPCAWIASTLGTIIANTLENTRSDVHSRLQNAFGKGGAIQALLRALVMDHEDPSAAASVVYKIWNVEKVPGTCLAVNVTRGLCSLFKNHPLNQDLGRKEGVAEALLSVMSLHKHDQCVQNSVCAALDAWCAGQRRYCEQLQQLGAVKHIHKAQRRLDGNADTAPLQQLLGRLSVGSSTAQEELDVLQESQKQKECQACVVCGKTAGELGVERLSKCSACTIAPRYCSAACQKSGWKSHKAECKANKK